LHRNRLAQIGDHATEEVQAAPVATPFGISGFTRGAGQSEGTITGRKAASQSAAFRQVLTRIIHRSDPSSGFRYSYKTETLWRIFDKIQKNKKIFRT